MALCGNCGRGYDHADYPFTCDVCGAENEQPGALSYDCSPGAVDDMEERIREFDRQDYREG